MSQRSGVSQFTYVTPDFGVRMFLSVKQSRLIDRIGFGNPYFSMRKARAIRFPSLWKRVLSPIPGNDFLNPYMSQTHRVRMSQLGNMYSNMTTTRRSVKCKNNYTYHDDTCNNMCKNNF